MAKIRVRDLPAKMEISEKEMRQMKGGATLPISAPGGLAVTRPSVAPLGGLSLTRPGLPTKGFIGISVRPGFDPRIGKSDTCDPGESNAVAGIRG
jgi:hypothetical protein